MYILKYFCLFLFIYRFKNEKSKKKVFFKRPVYDLFLQSGLEKSTKETFDWIPETQDQKMIFEGDKTQKRPSLCLNYKTYTFNIKTYIQNRAKGYNV